MPPRALTVNREWLHPDFLWYRKHLDRMKETKKKESRETTHESDSGY